MKWKEENKEGKERIVNKFLLIPRCIDSETRWLEKATIKQKLVKRIDFTGGGGYWYEWEDVCWM